MGVLQLTEQGIDNDPGSVVNRQQQRETAVRLSQAICGSCRLPVSAYPHAAYADAELGALVDAYRAGCSRRRSPAGDAACRELCLCLRVPSTTRSYACGWPPNTACAPDAAQRSSLPPISRWALYDLDDRGRVRLLHPSCMPPVCAWYACAHSHQRRCLLYRHMLRQQTVEYLKPCCSLWFNVTFSMSYML